MRKVSGSRPRPQPPAARPLRPPPTLRYDPIVRILWHRLLANPATRVLSREGDVARVKVEGLVCDRICAVRTKQALERIDGVREASVDLDSGVATVLGAPASDDAYERAVTSAVAARGARRAIERIANAVRRPAAGRAL